MSAATQLHAALSWKEKVGPIAFAWSREGLHGCGSNYHVHVCIMTLTIEPLQLQHLQSKNVSWSADPLHFNV